MRRSYRSERFLAILSRVRDQIPDAAITTDIIVGFPTETEADLAETLRVVEASRFSGAFTFQYSRAFSLTSWDVVERSERPPDERVTLVKVRGGTTWT